VQALCPQATCYLPNGVDFDHFDQQQSCPPEYSGLEGPIALYVGTLLKERFDFELVNMAAKRLPHVQFVIIGPGDHAKMDFDKRDNIHILGPRAHTDVPAYMQHADVGLIPFDVKKSPDLINCTNPLKLYEYLAAGIPVVSVSWEEVRKINSPALLSDNDEDFIAKISVALERKWDKNSLKDFSRRRDWENRFDELLETVEQLSARQQ
jgi:glycosyltransferase involved in cell wall biosynthesis